MRYVVFGVTVAAVLWLFESITDHRDRIVRLEEHDASRSELLLEVRRDVKELLRAENRRTGSEEGATARLRGVHSGGSTQ